MWLEAITVRTPELGDLERQIPVLLEQLSAESPGVQAAAYVRCPTNRDLSFHLIHSHGSGELTSQGLHLAEALRAYGTVDHSIWQLVAPCPISSRRSRQNSRTCVPLQQSSRA